MVLDFKFKKKKENKDNENQLIKILNFQNDFFKDDILPYEETEYTDQYDDEIVGDISDFEDDFFKDDTINYID